MFRRSLQFLIGEILVIFIAVGSFRFVADRLLAGVIAGLFFSLLGIWIVGTGLRIPQMRRSGTFWLGCVHLFAIALPMMITRLMNHALEFKDVLIWGIPGPVFHGISTGIYLAMMVATVIDCALVKWHERAQLRN